MWGTEGGAPVHGLDGISSEPGCHCFKSGCWMLVDMVFNSRSWSISGSVITLYLPHKGNYIHPNELCTRLTTVIHFSISLNHRSLAELPEDNSNLVRLHRTCRALQPCTTHASLSCSAHCSCTCNPPPMKHAPSFTSREVD